MAQAEIMGRMARETVLSPNPVKLNARCSTESIKEFQQLRQALVHILKSSSNKTSVFWKGALVRVADSDIHPLTHEETRLISASAHEPQESHQPPAMRTKSTHDANVMGLTFSTGITAPGNFLAKYKKTKGTHKFYIPAYIADRVNLGEYSLDYAKVDLFSLCLYIWEDNPKGILNTQHTVKHVSIVLPHFCYVQHLLSKQLQIIYNTTTTSIIQGDPV